MWDVLCDAQIWSCLWVPDFVRPGILRLSGALTNEFEQRSEISNAARATNRPPSANQCRCVTAGSGRRPVSAHTPSALAVRTPPPSVAEHRVVTALPSLSDHTPGQISRPEPSRQGFRSRKSASQNSRIMRQTHLRHLQDRAHPPPPPTPSPPRPLDSHRVRDDHDPSDGNRRLTNHCHPHARQSHPLPTGLPRTVARDSPNWQQTLLCHRG